MKDIRLKATMSANPDRLVGQWGRFLLITVKTLWETSWKPHAVFASKNGHCVQKLPLKISPYQHGIGTYLYNVHSNRSLFWTHEENEQSSFYSLLTGNSGLSNAERMGRRHAESPCYPPSIFLPLNCGYVAIIEP